jgi:hypothetical protein
MVLIYPDDWHDSVDRIRGDKGVLKVLVLGNKGTGKSSFIKFAIDRLLDRFPTICRLEADPGQPELTAPGVLSLALYEKSSSRPQISSQRLLGFVNPATNPFRYIDVLSRVHQDYVERHPSVPLFVNMHGWSTGTGIQTWEAAITVIRPDLLIYLGSDASEFEIQPNNPFVAEDMMLPAPEWTFLPAVIILEDDEEGLNLAKETSADRRWKKYAAHFRPDLLKKDEYKSCHPADFFKYPFVRLLRLERSKVAIKFSPEIQEPEDALRAIDSLIVGLCNAQSDQLVCLGHVMSFDENFLNVIIPPNIPAQYGGSIDLIVRGEMNWCPRDRVTHKGKLTSTDFLPAGSTGEPYFLPNVLAEEGSGSRTPSTRTNLRRKRLS